MKRPNADVERLEREVALLRRDNESLQAAPDPYPVSGCGDNSCEVAQSKGMATNGGCRCDERTLRRALRWHKRYVAHLRASIEELRREADGRDASPECCQFCHGTGVSTSVDAIEVDGRLINPRKAPCMICGGYGKVPR